VGASKSAPQNEQPRAAIQTPAIPQQFPDVGYVQASEVSNGMIMTGMLAPYYSLDIPLNPAFTANFADPYIEHASNAIAGQPNPYLLPTAGEKLPVTGSVFTAGPAHAASNQNRYEMPMTLPKQNEQPQSLSNAQPKRVEPVYHDQNMDQGM